MTWGSAQPNGGLIAPSAWALVRCTKRFFRCFFRVILCRDFFSRLNVRMERIVCDLNEEMDRADTAPADAAESRLEKIQEALKGR